MTNEQNHKNDGFSKYDTMSIEELQGILRLDAELPEGQESDEEMIFYVMEVLTQRRKSSDNPGKTVQEAWASFEQHYLPKEDEAEPIDAVPIKKLPKRPRIWLRRAVAAAAVLAILFGVPTVTGALSWRKVWTTVATWADGTFSFITTEGNPKKNPAADDGSFKAFREFLAKEDKSNAEVSMWKPEGFALDEIKVSQLPSHYFYHAAYRKGDTHFTIRIWSDAQSSSYIYQKDDKPPEIYTVSGVDFYIFRNSKNLVAVWVFDTYECSISGILTLEEIKMIIDSIAKG